MTPAAFAKLALRMWAAGMLFIYIPSKALFGTLSIMPMLLSGSIIEAGLLSMIVVIAVMIIASLVVWFQADRLALMLLPPGTSPEQGLDYMQWQRWGLVFFGGWSALMACLAFENFIVDPAFSRGLLPVVFNVMTAIILIVGWSNLTRLFSRKQTRD